MKIFCKLLKHKYHEIEEYQGPNWDIRMSVYKCDRCSILRMRIYSVDIGFVYADRIVNQEQIDKQLITWQEKGKNYIEKKAR